MPGPALIAIPLESGIEIHKSHISEKTVKNGACGAQVEAQVRQKFVKSSSRVCPAAPTERQSAPKCSLGPPNWCTFRTSWTTFAHYPSRLLPACTFHSKRPFQTALIGRLSSFGCAFEATARLGWIGWVASAWLSEIIVRWAAAAMLRNHWAVGCNASNFASRDFTGAVRRLCESSIFFMHTYTYIYI